MDTQLTLFQSIESCSYKTELKGRLIEKLSTVLLIIIAISLIINQIIMRHFSKILFIFILLINCNNGDNILIASFEVDGMSIKGGYL